MQRDVLEEWCGGGCGIELEALSCELGVSFFPVALSLPVLQQEWYTTRNRCSAFHGTHRATDDGGEGKRKDGAAVVPFVVKCVGVVFQ